MLGSTVASVNSVLKRARATLQRRLGPTGERAPAPAPDSPAERAMVARFVHAYDSGHIDDLVDLLTADVSISMPPIPLEYEGRELAARFLATVSRQGRRYDLVPTRANGQLAFGVYLRQPSGGIRHATGLDVVTLTGDRVGALTRFDVSVLASFGLPRSLPGRSAGRAGDA
jgi:SnoaL-like domain